MIFTIQQLDGLSASGESIRITVANSLADGGGGGGVSDHGALTGLADDDHTQYHTDARGDARYDALGDAAAAQAAAEATAAAALTAHEAAANPHPGYLTSAEGDAAYDALGAAAAAQTAAEATAAAALSGHTGDTSDAHDASAISVTPTGAIAATDVQAALAELDTEKQPLDSDLTAIAALTTTAYGRSLLEAANASGLRTLAGLILGTDIYSKAAVDAGFQPLDSDLTAIAALSTTSYGRALLAAADLAALQAILGTGTPSASTFLRGDGSWAAPSASIVRASALGDGSGDHTSSTTSFADIHAQYSVTIAASAGQHLLVTFTCALFSNSTSNALDLGLNIGGTVRAGTVHVASATSKHVPCAVQVDYTVQSGDISGGLVTVKPQWKVSANSIFMSNGSGRLPSLTVLNLG
jgi:hypothetical protein